jgi:hypothetical protein
MTPKKSFNDAVNNTQVRGSHASLMFEHAELMEATRDNARSRTSSGEPAPSSDALDNRQSFLLLAEFLLDHLEHLRSEIWIAWILVGMPSFVQCMELALSRAG